MLAAVTEVLPNCAELDASWTPQYAGIVAYWQLNGTGSLSTSDTIPATEGASGTSTNGQC